MFPSTNQLLIVIVDLHKVLLLSKLKYTCCYYSYFLKHANVIILYLLWKFVEIKIVEI